MASINDLINGEDRKITVNRGPLLLIIGAVLGENRPSLDDIADMLLEDDPAGL
jgi:hypothetical protein